MAYAIGLLVDLLNKKENIYCFGAGRTFHSFVQEFAEYGLKDSIKAIVDNSKDVLKNPIKVVKGLSFPLISYEEMVRNITDNDRILITTEAYEEIIEQIKKTKKLLDVDYYIYSVMKIEQYDYNRLKIEIPSQLSSCNSIRIPKTIHYCWFGGKALPDLYKNCIESWRRYCPEYEIVEWNEKNYDVCKNRYISQAYELRQWAFVSDYVRIDIINQYGGIYLDADVELLKNIDELRMNNAFCGFESEDYVNYGLGFGSIQNQPILDEIKEYYEKNYFIHNNGSLNLTSCPHVQTEIMKKHGLKCNGKFQIIDGMVVYPSRILCGMSPHSFRVEKDLAHTYAIHHFSGSWIKDKQEKNKLISTMMKWSKNDNYIYLK